MRAFALLLGLGLALGCHHEPKPYHPKEGELPPLPPASGTPVGYLLDAATDLKLRDEQIAKLKDIDASLAARNASIDTQLRQIERPEDDEPMHQQQRRGQPPKRHNNAPGAAVKTSADASKLHAAHKANDRDALKAAFALLDPTQQEAARRLIEDHGFEAPGSQKKIEKHDDDGTPALPGLPREP